MQVAWVGLGSMGRPMAAAAARRGHVVRGYARRPEEQTGLVDAGGEVLSDPVEAVAGAEIICVNLFSEAQVEAVFLENDLLSALASGAVLVLHSTVSPAFVSALAGRRGDVDVLDAGFSGGPQEASDGRLTLMVGGDAGALARARPVLETYAGHIAHVGGAGAGMTLKVINNLMFAANVAVARDAMRLVASSGLDLGVAVETLTRGSAGSNALTILGRGGQPEAVVAAIRPYLEKDVPIARRGAGPVDLGALDAATREFDR
jgi:3-hydroxyisobutyrate dehydrogenase-like beta-hydroxyacid dehydrogenase